ncbi:hypothetical protein AALP_AA1G336700 [Arabis alpina]|uniref:Uncharacterized protein n=1 Tax=Arabis alpina TaxID=50452 RepID=A0A087HSE1_ARAAL|nr:hypothetical protein AALP_AA1G336700 [Arabis alpina]
MTTIRRGASRGHGRSTGSAGRSGRGHGIAKTGVSKRPSVRNRDTSAGGSQNISKPQRRVPTSVKGSQNISKTQPRVPALGDGLHALSKAQGKLPALGGGFLRLSKAPGKPSVSGDGSLRLSKAQANPSASAGSSHTLSKSVGRRVVVGGEDVSTREENHNHRGSPTRGVKSTDGQTCSINSNRNKPPSHGTLVSQANVSASRTRSLPLQYPLTANRCSSPRVASPTLAANPSPNLNLNHQPNHEDFEMEYEDEDEEEEEEDEEEDFEGDDEKVEHVQGDYEGVGDQEAEAEDYQQLLDNILALPGCQNLPLLSESMYNWDIGITQLVRFHFNAIATKRMRRIVSQAKTKGVRPIWIEVQAKSITAANSRMSHRNGLGAQRHRSGQSSYLTIQQDMEEELGRHVSWGEVFVKTHTNKDGSFTVADAPENSDASENSTHRNLTVAQKNEIFLKIRLEHILERISLICKAANTEKPSMIQDNLFIGGGLAARSVYTLQHLGITHILCLYANKIGQSDTQYPDLFEYQNFSITDDEDSNIESIFQEALDFINHGEEAGGKILVHCLEGRSRSTTVVLAYLMLRKRAQPNDGFARILLNLDKKCHGKVSMEWRQRKPTMKVCPVCGKNAGLSSSSLKLYLQKSHKKLSSGSVDSAMNMEIQKALEALKLSTGRGSNVSSNSFQSHTG